MVLEESAPRFWLGPPGKGPHGSGIRLAQRPPGAGRGCSSFQDREPWSVPEAPACSLTGGVPQEHVCPGKNRVGGISEGWIGSV